MKTWKLMMAVMLCCGLVCSFGILGCSDDDDDNRPDVPDVEDVCDDGIDNDLDGCLDEADVDCGGMEADCEDTLDNDCDGLIDDLDLDDCAGGFCFIVAAN